MKGWVVALLSVAIAALVVAPPTAASPSMWELLPGAHQYERLEFQGQTTLRIEVDIASGSQVTMLLLDQANLQLFEANRTYQAVHESTTLDQLTVTVDVGAGTWYVVMDDRGPDPARFNIDITWASGGGGSDPFVSSLWLVLGVVVLAAVVVVGVLVLRKGKVGGR
jgi:hypothetical protein